MLADIKDYTQRINQGKASMEAPVARNFGIQLASKGSKLEDATAHEDKRDKIDRWIKSPDGVRRSVQIKCREAGDDLIFEIIKDVRTWENGRDYVCKANLYLHVDRQGKGWLYDMKDIKTSVEALRAYAIKDLEANPCRTKWNWKTCEMKVTTDRAHGNDKLMVFFSPTHFPCISTFSNLYD